MLHRPATPEDLAAIRDLQIDSWRRAYAGILPDAFLGREVETILGDRWQALPGPHWIVDTMWDGGALAGFVTVDRLKGPGAYVDNLHVVAAAQGRGVGRILMARAARQLAGETVPRLWLTVIRENEKARSFYRGIGGAEGPEQAETLYGQPIVTLPVEWADLPALADLAAAR